ncbi:MAG: ATP-grasp domain-containing protein [Myxococcota bacterium]
MSRLGIIADQTDLIARHLARVASDRGHSTTFLPLDGPVPIAYDGEGWLIGGADPAEFDGFFVRRYPAPTAKLFEDSATPAGALIWEAAKQQLERSQLATSCLWDLERQKKRFVNPPSVTAGLDMKPLQLAMLRQAGVPLPRTLITNFPPAVRAFERDLPEVVAKPLSGGAEARLLGAVDDQTLAGIQDSPTIFQERIAGADIRVTVVDEEILSAVEIASSTLDYRSGAAYRAGQAEYRPHALPGEIAELCRRVVRCLGHILSGIDLKLQPDGSYVVLEANSGPVYLDIEMKTHAPITEAIVRYLAGDQV